MSLPTRVFDLAPFYIEHYQTDETAGRFIPQARLYFSDNLRTSGLLSHLGDEGARALLAILSCLTPNGHIHVTAPELATILQVSERHARDRLHRLCRMQWQSAPLLQELPRDNGPSAYSPTATLIGKFSTEIPVGVSATLPIPPFAPRDAVIEHSRTTYGTPRAVAERMVEEQLGRSPEELADTPVGDLRRRLRSLGISRDDADRLLTNHTAQEIGRQLDWLPARRAKSPTRFLIAAVQGNYAPPQELPQLTGDAETSVAVRTQQADGEPSEASVK